VRHFLCCQALFVDPIADKADAAEKLLGTGLEKQRQGLGYIK
jgi:hypothetical protein